MILNHVTIEFGDKSVMTGILSDGNIIQLQSRRDIKIIKISECKGEQANEQH